MPERPLRLLFMASAPEGVEPVLNFEAEEAAILAATAGTGTELVVEESGTLDGLRATAESYGAGYFDVLHLTGHARIHGGQPRFVLENDLGGPVLASADEIARALDGHWPRVVFLSGCRTAGASDDDTFPSMSDSLHQAGAPVVLGWALPVGDEAATQFATRFYRALAAGEPLGAAVAGGPGQGLRVYADDTSTPLVTPQDSTSRAADRKAFVGRRRVIQRCLRTLRESPALLLHGMSGIGKSALAARLLERIPTYRPVIRSGRVDAVEIPDGADPCVFLFDDFEDGNLEERDDEYVLAGPMARILPDLLAAVEGTDSRIIITSRYRFDADVAVESLETLTAVEQAKMVATLPVPADITNRAIAAAGGNPRLLERLDRAGDDPERDAARFAAEQLAGADATLRTMLATVDVVEVPIPAETLSAMYDHPDAAEHVRRAVRRGLLEEGTDPATNERRYLVPPVLRSQLAPLVTDDARRAACAAAARSLYRVWGRLQDRWAEVHRLAVAGGETAIARQVGAKVSQIWLGQSRFAEVARLSERTLTLGDDAHAFYHLGWARFATGARDEALVAYDRALALFEAAGDRSGEATTWNNIGAAHVAMGDRRRALECFERALPILRAAGDRTGEATALSNIGTAHAALGDHEKARDCHERALRLMREAGNRSGEATVLNNLGSLLVDEDDLPRTLEHLRQVLRVVREEGNRVAEAGALANLAGVHHALGQTKQALETYGQALRIQWEIGDRSGEATTLNLIGEVYADRDDVYHALNHLQEARSIRRQIRDRLGEVETLNTIGDVYAGTGDAEQALGYYRRALSIAREVGDRATEAESLHKIGSARNALQGLDDLRQALIIRQEIGDRSGEADTRYRIAMAHREGGRLGEAVAEMERVVAIEREIGHPDLDTDTETLEGLRREVSPRR